MTLIVTFKSDLFSEGHKCPCQAHRLPSLTLSYIKTRLFASRRELCHFNELRGAAEERLILSNRIIEQLKWPHETFMSRLNKSKRQCGGEKERRELRETDEGEGERLGKDEMMSRV